MSEGCEICRGLSGLFGPVYTSDSIASATDNVNRCVLLVLGFNIHIELESSCINTTYYPSNSPSTSI